MSHHRTAPQSGGMSWIAIAIIAFFGGPVALILIALAFRNPTLPIILLLGAVGVCVWKFSQGFCDIALAPGWREAKAARLAAIKAASDAATARAATAAFGVDKSAIVPPASALATKRRPTALAVSTTVVLTGGPGWRKL